jgi:hypothetical protein
MDTNRCQTDYHNSVTVNIQNIPLGSQGNPTPSAARSVAMLEIEIKKGRIDSMVGHTQIDIWTGKLTRHAQSVIFI